MTGRAAQTKPGVYAEPFRQLIIAGERLTPTLKNVLSMTACDHCAADGAFLYTCPDCGDHFCDEHRDPYAHECGSPTNEHTAEEEALAAGSSDGPTEVSPADTTGEPEETFGDDTAEATVPGDENPGAANEATVDPDPATSSEVVQDDDGESTDLSEARGGTGRIPLLGRFFS